MEKVKKKKFKIKMGSKELVLWLAFSANLIQALHSAFLLTSFILKKKKD